MDAFVMAGSRKAFDATVGIANGTGKRFVKSALPELRIRRVSAFADLAQGSACSGACGAERFARFGV
jgi:hypothetical protein